MMQTSLTFIPETGLISNAEFLHKIAELDIPTVSDKRKISYYNIPAAFDIEVSSFYDGDEKKSCMYIWQFGLLNWVTYGRTWDEFQVFIKILSEILGLSYSMRLPVYIHNLAYEFQFLRKRFSWDNVFFMDERKPIYAISNGIEYRCSLKLSSKSLARLGNDLQKYKVEKMTGDLDYELIRNSETPLTEKELKYCENDIRVVLAYIQEKIEIDGSVLKIPYTNTGYVRNYCRKECFRRYGEYRDLMSFLTISSDEYKQLKRGFCGGFTHAAPHYAGQVLKNVGSFDFTSSYPAVMLLEKFPMSQARVVEKIDSLVELNSYLTKYCCLFDVTFHNLTPKAGYDFPISISKAIDVDQFPVIANGRVVSADFIKVTCTEQDFYVYTEFYNFSSFDVSNFRIYDKAYLPKPFVMSILQLYKDKTTLKGVTGEEINYMIKKNMLNSAYGMSVTDIVRDEVEYINDSFISTKPNMEEAIENYNNSGKRFLFYPWGVWVTAYARANLFSGILACGDDYVYSDTDSIKILNPEKHLDYIKAYNSEVLQKISSAASFHGISVDEFSPTSLDGEKKTIGLWDDEGIYDEFKTIGAKRYMTRKGSKYSLTVAGLNKKTAMDYISKNYNDPFDGLHDGLVVPAEYSGRLTATYFDEEASGYVKDYLGNIAEYDELSYVHLEKSEYEMGVSPEFKQFVAFTYGIKEDSW